MDNDKNTNITENIFSDINGYIDDFIDEFIDEVANEETINIDSVHSTHSTHSTNSTLDEQQNEQLHGESYEEPYEEQYEQQYEQPHLTNPTYSAPSYTQNNDPIYEFENVEGEESVEVIRYVLEAYSSKKPKNLNNRDKFRWFTYFIPEHKLEVMVRSYGTYLSKEYNREPIEINYVESPKNRYQMEVSGSIIESPLEKVRVTKKWVNLCVDTYNLEQKIKILKNQIFFQAPIAKTKHEIAHELFNEGMKCFESHNFANGREKFMECLKILNGDTSHSCYDLCFYNIACCYSREHMKAHALVWLCKAVKNNYFNWAHTITDSDMIELLEEPDFVEIVKAMMIANPKRDFKILDIPKEFNSIDIFLKKHNLEQYEK